MFKFRDPVYLATHQYKDTGNLNARIQLHEHSSTNPYGWFRWVFDQFDLSRMMHILELGSGSGKLWVENLDRIPNEWQVMLTDFSQGMMLGCRANLIHKQNQFRCEVFDAIAIPFPTATFDTIIANHMLYHVLDRSRALAEISRVLKPDGTFYTATNGVNHLRELDELIKQHYPFTDNLIPSKPSSGFNLENGANQLASWFKQVEVRIYQDSLVVTNAKPLAAYIRSMIPRSEAGSKILSRYDIDQIIEDMILRRGSIHIQKSSGLFIAKK